MTADVHKHTVRQPVTDGNGYLGFTLIRARIRGGYGNNGCYRLPVTARALSIGGLVQ